MQPSLDPHQLDTGTLALLVGHGAALLVREELAEHGFADLRFSHGHVIQCLIDDEPTVGKLAAYLGMTQQGASKAVAELERLGYCERGTDAADARIRRVRLTGRGQEAVATARRAHTALDQRLADRFGKQTLAEHRDLLVQLLDELSGTAEVEGRAVRPPR